MHLIAGVAIQAEALFNVNNYFLKTYMSCNIHWLHIAKTPETAFQKPQLAAK
jgi:hypothetical protein